jgi:hypothetical protein
MRPALTQKQNPKVTTCASTWNDCENSSQRKAMATEAACVKIGAAPHLTLVAPLQAAHLASAARAFGQRLRTHTAFFLSCRSLEHGAACSPKMIRKRWHFSIFTGPRNFFYFFVKPKIPTKLTVFQNCMSKITKLKKIEDKITIRLAHSGINTIAPFSFPPPWLVHVLHEWCTLGDEGILKVI